MKDPASYLNPFDDIMVYVILVFSLRGQAINPQCEPKCGAIMSLDSVDDGMRVDTRMLSIVKKKITSHWQQPISLEGPRGPKRQRQALAEHSTSTRWR